jgi:hypothetical protein
MSKGGCYAPESGRGGEGGMRSAGYRGAQYGTWGMACRNGAVMVSTFTELSLTADVGCLL